MKKNSHSLILASLMLAAGNAAAEEAAVKSPWTSSVELGLIRTTGNTETQTSALKGDVAYEVDKWRHKGHVEGYGQQAEDDTGSSVVSAERYELSGKSDYKFTERDYAFGLVQLQKDRFSGFEYENTVAVGYGRKLLKESNMELDVEIGPGVKFFKLDDGESDDQSVLRLSGNYWWKITPTSKFTQDITSDIGEDFTTTKSVTGIQANINSALALKFTYTIKNKSEVPVGTEKTDTEAAMTLVYNF